MFSHAYVRPVWLKCTIVALPFVAIVLDVSSWYFTKLYHPFAWVVIGAGGLMGLCFASMWVVTMYQLWFSPPPTMVRQRERAASGRLTAVLTAASPAKLALGWRYDSPARTTCRRCCLFFRISVLEFRSARPFTCSKRGCATLRLGLSWLAAGKVRSHLDERVVIKKLYGIIIHRIPGAYSGILIQLASAKSADEEEDSRK
jgi:hypothetical protein